VNSERIGIAEVKMKVELLNAISRKKYMIETISDGFRRYYRLCVCLNGVDSRDGLSDVSVWMTSREIYYTISTIIAYCRAEKEEAYKDKARDYSPLFGEVGA
jgi:hypothetical protein